MDHESDGPANPWQKLYDHMNDLPEVTFSIGPFLTDDEEGERYDEHMQACLITPCAECGMGSCGEYHHLGPRGNGVCSEQWCPIGRNQWER